MSRFLFFLVFIQETIEISILRSLNKYTQRNEISRYNIPRNFIPPSIVVPEVLRALLIDYFVYHDRPIKIDDLINGQSIIVPGTFLV